MATSRNQRQFMVFLIFVIFALVIFILFQVKFLREKGLQEPKPKFQDEMKK